VATKGKLWDRYCGPLNGQSLQRHYIHGIVVNFCRDFISHSTIVNLLKPSSLGYINIIKFIY